MGYGRVNPHKNNGSSPAPVLLILGGVVLIFGLSMAILSQENANAVNNYVRKAVWDKNGIRIDKFCDGRNLIYILDPNRMRNDTPTFFVSPNDPQCK